MKSSRHNRDRSRTSSTSKPPRLLDREGDEADETISPSVDLNEQGSHARFASGMAPEPKLDSEPEARTTGMRPKAPLKAAARSMLGRGAGLLRRVADRLERYST